MNNANGKPEGDANSTVDPERLQAAWLECVRSNLGRDPIRADAAAKAAREVIASGGAIKDAYDAARSTWQSMPVAGGDYRISEAKPPLTTAIDVETAMPVVERILFTIGVAYAGFVVGIGIIGALYTPEYEHVWYLQVGLIFLTWAMVATLAVAVSAITVRRNASRLGGQMQWLIAALQAPVVIGVAVLLPFSIASLYAYRAGIAAYEAAVQSCGQPPVLAWGGWGAHITLPTNSDYDRLKYSTKDFLQWGPPVYFCTASDAEAHGYPMIS